MDAGVAVNDARHRFEHDVDGHVAFLDYRLEEDRLTLVHTEVPEALGGRGLGAKLVSAALAYAKENGLTVVPQCSYVRSYLERKPEAAAGITVADPEDG
ncbi:MAG: GNAT family N-acetyltransferase [Actinomycetota bacterium]